MQDGMTIQFARLTAKLREAQASEVAFLAAINESLRIAIDHRDWQLVRTVMKTIETLADDLASIHDRTS